MYDLVPTRQNTLLQIVQNSKVTLPMLNPMFVCSVPYPNNAIRTNENHRYSRLFGRRQEATKLEEQDDAKCMYVVENYSIGMKTRVVDEWNVCIWMKSMCHAVLVTGERCGCNIEFCIASDERVNFSQNVPLSKGFSSTFVPHSTMSYRTECVIDFSWELACKLGPLKRTLKFLKIDHSMHCKGVDQFF